MGSQPFDPLWGLIGLCAAAACAVLGRERGFQAGQVAQTLLDGGAGPLWDDQGVLWDPLGTWWDLAGGLGPANMVELSRTASSICWGCLTRS